ncbi:MAG TPA: glycosyl transferase family 1 [Rhizobiaceae bacterium]|nr:glycosyl transferase family 1 [Rhizobiaceae bacterium]
MLHVLYLVHDVADPAVRRRVLMLKAGGAGVTLAGFRRTDRVTTVAGVEPIDLGQTRDADFAQRLLAVISAAASLKHALQGVDRPDLIIARNLEMLALAKRAKTAFDGDEIPVAYECLDVHRLMLRADPLGKTMRAAERYLARDVRLLMTSSPAFLKEYFKAYGQVSAPVELLENKHFENAFVLPDSLEEPSRPEGPPWRFGWFGALRCTKSLGILSTFAERQAGRFQITLRGKPAPTAVPDFDARVDASPHLTFKGAYRNPEDIEAIYREVHFSWVIDFFEERQNSKWLLPNRLYEGCRFGAVPIALEGTETGRFLAERGIGIVLPHASPEVLERVLGHIDATRMTILRSAVSALGRKAWACDHHDCKELVARLETLRAGATETRASV